MKVTAILILTVVVAVLGDTHTSSYSSYSDETPHKGRHIPHHENSLSYGPPHQGYGPPKPSYGPPKGSHRPSKGNRFEFGKMISAPWKMMKGAGDYMRNFFDDIKNKFYHAHGSILMSRGQYLSGKGKNYLKKAYKAKAQGKGNYQGYGGIIYDDSKRFTQGHKKGYGYRMKGALNHGKDTGHHKGHNFQDHHAKGHGHPQVNHGYSAPQHGLHEVHVVEHHGSVDGHGHHNSVDGHGHPQVNHGYISPQHGHNEVHVVEHHGNVEGHGHHNSVEGHGYHGSTENHGHAVIHPAGYSGSTSNEFGVPKPSDVFHPSGGVFHAQDHGASGHDQAHLISQAYQQPSVNIHYGDQSFAGSESHPSLVAPADNKKTHFQQDQGRSLGHSQPASDVQVQQRSARQNDIESIDISRSASYAVPLDTRPIPVPFAFHVQPSSILIPQSFFGNQDQQDYH